MSEQAQNSMKARDDAARAKLQSQGINHRQSTSMQQMEHVNQTFMPHYFAMFQGMQVLARIGLSWIATPVEVILRKNFGERHFDFARAWIGLMVVIGVGLFSMATGRAGGVLIWIILLPLYVVLAAYNLWTINRRRFLGIPYHSRSRGDSRLEKYLPMGKNFYNVFRLDRWMVIRVIEPAILLVFAIVVGSINGVLTMFSEGYNDAFGFAALAILAALSSGSLLIEANLSYLEDYYRHLDQVDARIKADALLEASQFNKAKPESTVDIQHRGFIVSPAVFTASRFVGGESAAQSQKEDDEVLKTSNQQLLQTANQMFDKAKSQVLHVVNQVTGDAENDSTEEKDAPKSLS